MSREIMQQALAYIKDIRDHCACEGIDCEEETNLVVALEQELAKPEQATVSFPSFMRRRIEEAIELAINPKGMSVHDGKATVYASDLQRMIAVIDLAKPEQKLTEEGEAWGEMAKKMSRDFMESANKNWELPPKSVGTITIGELRKTDLYRRMATQSLREAFTPPRKEWVGLTDEEIWKDEEIMIANSGYGATFETLRELTKAISTKLKEKNT